MMMSRKSKNSDRNENKKYDGPCESGEGDINGSQNSSVNKKNSGKSRKLDQSKFL